MMAVDITEKKYLRKVKLTLSTTDVMICVQRLGGNKDDSQISAWKTWCKVIAFTEIGT